MEQCYGCKSLAERIEQTERALDAEREKVKRLSTCGTDHSTPWWQVKCEDLEAQLATLQAQLRQVEGERDRAEGALIRAGFRKDCDIAACNCGPQWGHGGHASQRLREIADALPYQNGGVLLERIESLVRENTTLRQLVAQLPVYKDVSISHRVDENDFETWKVWVDHNPLAECDTEGEASAIKGLLTYRATLVVQDAPQPAPNERVEYARLELAALFSTPGAPTLEQAKLVCENKNPADAQCILNAYEALREADQDAGKGYAR